MAQWKQALREVGFKAFRSADDNQHEQYPNPSSMPHRDSIGSDGRPVIRRERSKINSFDTAIHSPSGTNDVVNDGRSHDFLDRYNHQRRDTVLSTGIVLKQQRSSGSSSGSDAFAFPSGNDDTSQSAAAPAEFGNWRSHKLRTRYSCMNHAMVSAMAWS